MGLLHAVIAPKKKIIQQKNGGSTPVQTSSLLLPVDYKQSRPNWKCKQASCAAMAISVLQFDSKLEIKQASVTTFSCAPTGMPPLHSPPVNHTGGYWGSVSLGLKGVRGRVSVFIMRCICTYMQVKTGEKNKKLVQWRTLHVSFSSSMSLKAWKPTRYQGILMHFTQLRCYNRIHSVLQNEL